ncbi:MAG: phosphorylase [Candidatus Sulfotelmatobacter sp.]
MNSSSCKLAIVAALEREVAGLIKTCSRVDLDHQGHKFSFFEGDDIVLICGGIGAEPARRAAEAVIALYHPHRLQSVGFAGALVPNLRAGDIFEPAVIIDARDGSRFEIEDASGHGVLVSFMAVAGVEQKAKLAQAYAAHAVDMEAASVAAAARAHGIRFAATKVISDEFNFDLPDMERFVDSQGRFRTAAFITFAAVRPLLWTRIATLARASSKAEKALSQHLKRFCFQALDAVEANTT